MPHPQAHLPSALLKGIEDFTIYGKTLVKADATLTDLGLGTYWALVGALIFTLVYKLSRYYTPLYFKGYRWLSLHEQRDWDSRLGNILYSAYIVYWAVRLLAVEDLFWRPGPTPMVLRTSHDSWSALGVSVGFFAMELVITLKHWMGGGAMVVHHVGSLTCVLMALLGAHGHAFTLWMLSTEFTTPFIALRYCLDKAGLKSHPLYLINGLAILTSWAVARLATFPPFFLTVWRYREQMRLMDPFSQALVLCFPVLLAGLNTFWFTKIVAGAIRLFMPQGNREGPTRTAPTTTTTAQQQQQQQQTADGADKKQD